jgi:antitoxin MazE
MVQSVLKWGNSLALRIPSAIAKQMDIEEGAELEVRVEGRRLVVEKADQLPEFSHSDFVRALSNARKDLVEFGQPRGNEVL